MASNVFPCPNFLPFNSPSPFGKDTFLISLNSNDKWLTPPWWRRRCLVERIDLIMNTSVIPLAKMCNINLDFTEIMINHQTFTRLFSGLVPTPMASTDCPAVAHKGPYHFMFHQVFSAASAPVPQLFSDIPVYFWPRCEHAIIVHLHSLLSG